MHRILVGLSVFLVPLILFACVQLSKETEEAPEVVEIQEKEEVVEPPPPPLEEEDLVTRNVTYTGILEEGGVTIYQEGSHRLMLSDGKMVLLEPAEGEVMPLGLYVSKLVRVQGDVSPTVEAGGTIMKVKEIHWIRREVDEEGNEEEVLRVLCGGEESAVCSEGFVCELGEEEGVCVESSGASVSDPEEGADEDSEKSEADENEGPPAQEGGQASEESDDESGDEGEDDEDSGQESGDEEEEEPIPTNGRHAKAIELMTDEDYASERWTQEYCSEHVGFCVPVHKNWYYKSFGAMTSILWHIEMGAQPVEVMGDGPLLVELKSGDLASIGVTDGEVKVVGSEIIGYRAWNEGRHFEVTAPAGIEEAVRFVTDGLKSSDG